MPAASDWSWDRWQHDDSWSWSDQQKPWSASVWEQPSADWDQPNTNWSNYAPITRKVPSDIAFEHDPPWPREPATASASSSSAVAEEALAGLIADFANELQAEADRAQEAEAARQRCLQQPEAKAKELSKRIFALEGMKADLARRAKRLLAVVEQSGNADPSSLLQSEASCSSTGVATRRWLRSQASRASNAAMQIDEESGKHIPSAMRTARVEEQGCQAQASPAAQNWYPYQHSAPWQSAVLCGNTSRSGHSVIAVDTSSLVFTLDEYDLDEHSRIDNRFQFVHEKWHPDLQHPTKQVHDFDRIFCDAHPGSLDHDLKQVLLADCGMIY